MSIANELITRGWTRGREEDNRGRVCLLGAIKAAYGGIRFVSPFEAVAKVLGVHSSVGIARWNDHPLRTFDEVLRVAKMADELLEEAQ